MLYLLPPPEDGVLTLTGDGSHADKRGTKNPLAQPGRQREHHTWFFGLRFVLLSVRRDVLRLSVVFRVIRPKSHSCYRTENALFREMVRRFTPPAWATASSAGYRDLRTAFQRRRCERRLTGPAGTLDPVFSTAMTCSPARHLAPGCIPPALRHVFLPLAMHVASFGYLLLASYRADALVHPYGLL